LLAFQQGCAPFGSGIDAFGFYNNIDQAEAQRFADVEITHGRVAMLASLGFLVGEEVEGSGFLFDASVTGPAINHFQQVPTFFWVALGVGVVLTEVTRINVGLHAKLSTCTFRVRGTMLHVVVIQDANRYVYTRPCLYYEYSCRFFRHRWRTHRWAVFCPPSAACASISCLLSVLKTGPRG